MKPSFVLINRFDSSFYKKIIGTILIVSLVIKFIVFLLNVRVFDILNWQFSEFLINYEGGFVRRGLLGQGLYSVCKYLSISPGHIIIVFCLLVYSGVAIFYVQEFRKKGYCWWILCSPLLCGYITGIIRKDYFSILCIILCLLILRRYGSVWAKICVVVIGIVCIFIHEAFIFYGIPAIFIVLFSEKKDRLLCSLLLTISMIFSAIVCLNKGNPSIVASIANSWMNVQGLENIDFTQARTVNTLTWATINTFRRHLSLNFYSPQFGISLIFYRFVVWMIAYYFYTNFLFVFNRQKMTKKTIEIKKFYLSTVYVILTICLLPMFTVLSCDWGRVYLYATFPALALFLLFPVNKFKPVRYVGRKLGILQLNRFLGNIVKPRKGIMTILLLFIGISPFGHEISLACEQSPIGSILFFFSKTVPYYVFPHISSLFSQL